MIAIFELVITVYYALEIFFLATAQHVPTQVAKLGEGKTYRWVRNRLILDAVLAVLFFSDALIYWLKVSGTWQSVWQISFLALIVVAFACLAVNNKKWIGTLAIKEETEEEPETEGEAVEVSMEDAPDVEIVPADETVPEEAEEPAEETVEEPTNDAPAEAADDLQEGENV